MHARPRAAKARREEGAGGGCQLPRHKHDPTRCEIGGADGWKLGCPHEELAQQRALKGGAPRPMPPSLVLAAWRPPAQGGQEGSQGVLPLRLPITRLLRVVLSPKQQGSQKEGREGEREGAAEWGLQLCPVLKGCGWGVMTHVVTGV